MGVVGASRRLARTHHDHVPALYVMKPNRTTSATETMVRMTLSTVGLHQKEHAWSSWYSQQGSRGSRGAGAALAGGDLWLAFFCGFVAWTADRLGLLELDDTVLADLCGFVAWLADRLGLLELDDAVLADLLGLLPVLLERVLADVA